ncbi:DUF2461 domain-containing protein [Hafnia alvei]|uniref:DUF2461 domain-containing protein n=1 Tax=Hafnia alvei TaxID=569 RepID=UPI001034717B|nr:DUF2461 domain-containing protein [Hafnia alvei]MEB7889853.1 DUF2461 domain-containing protein [Hafnia alvei]TBL88980.1 DUF2461 domain-containing protein [Hafnia alvei]
MKETKFTGFTQQGLNFLQQVRIENSKDWFEEHRPIYDQHILTPFRALVDELAKPMLKIDPLFETRPAIGKTLSRIHRDTRFSHDKSRYRSRMWLTFKRHSKEWTDAPVFFFEISPDMLRYGLGYYSASRGTMDRFRHLALRQPEEFAAARACCKAPFELVGDSYKRPLIKDQDPEIADWYNRKTFAVMATDYQVEQLFTPELATMLVKKLTKLARLYHFLMKVEALKQVPLEDL